MSEPELFEMSLALQRLRAALEASNLPSTKLRKLRAEAAELGDQCYFNIGWLCAKPDREKAVKLSRANLAKIETLTTELSKPKRKVGARPKEKVPLDALTIALQYLNQPAVENKSVEELTDIAIGHGGFGGKRNAKPTSDIARRIRRLIKRIETARAEELATE
jgi:hypothetical protein